MKAGSFVKDQDGTIFGKIQALGLGNLDAIFAERLSKEGKPYFKVIADPGGNPFEIGSAWPKEKDGLHYYSVSLDTVLSPKPINAALFPDKTDSSIYNLVWNQQEPKLAAEAKTDEKAEPEAEPKAGTRAAPKTGTRQTHKRRAAAMSAKL